MKKELTVGDILAILVIIVGWAISVEVRLTSVKDQAVNTEKSLTEMVKDVKEIASQVKDIHEEVIRHDERINADLPQVKVRGTGEFYGINKD